MTSSRDQLVALLTDALLDGNLHPQAPEQRDRLSRALDLARGFDASTELVEFVQGRRRDCLRALRACTDGGSADYWRWQGHAELSRQLLERLGADVPR